MKKSNDDEFLNDKQSLKELIMCHLLDDTFTSFVEEIEQALNELVFNEINK